MAYSSETVVPSPPADSVSCLKFQEASNSATILLAASSWDGTLSVWQVDSSSCKSECKFRKTVTTQAIPVLHISWYKDSSKIFCAMADNTIKAVCLQTQQVVDIGSHNGPVSSCHFYEASNVELLLSASYDKSLKFWDLRQTANPYVVNMSERVTCADVYSNFGVVCTFDNKVHLFNLSGQPAMVKEKKMNNFIQMSDVKIMKDESNRPMGCVIASSLGKVSFEVPDQEKQSIVFPCHRTKNPGDIEDVYSINTLAINPVHRTLATAGSDGLYAFWDLHRRTNLYKSRRQSSILPITACHINPMGNMFVYAKGYDWSKGYSGYTDSMTPSIAIVSCFNDMKKKS
ncbi:MAG: Poly(A)+ RNA export protein rae1 [Marteilia pararefringens]